MCLVAPKTSEFGQLSKKRPKVSLLSSMGTTPNQKVMQISGFKSSLRPSVFLSTNALPSPTMFQAKSETRNRKLSKAPPQWKSHKHALKKVALQFILLLIHSWSLWQLRWLKSRTRRKQTWLVVMNERTNNDNWCPLLLHTEHFGDLWMKLILIIYLFIWGIHFVLLFYLAHLFYLVGVWQLFWSLS